VIFSRRDEGRERQNKITYTIVDIAIYISYFLASHGSSENHWGLLGILLLSLDSLKLSFPSSHLLYDSVFWNMDWKRGLKSTLLSNYTSIQCLCAHLCVFWIPYVTHNIKIFLAAVTDWVVARRRRGKHVPSNPHPIIEGRPLLGKRPVNTHHSNDWVTIKRLFSMRFASRSCLEDNWCYRSQLRVHLWSVNQLATEAE
jgi:hypothetical protein